MRTLLAVIAAVASGCGKGGGDQPPVPQPRVAPVAWGGPPIDCAQLWTVDEIASACHERVVSIDNGMEGVPFDSGVPSVGRTIRVCARQVTLDKRPSTEVIGLDLIAYETDALASKNGPAAPGVVERFGAISHVRSVKGRLQVQVSALSKTPLCADGLVPLHRLVEGRVAGALATKR